MLKRLVSLANGGDTKLKVPWSQRDWPECFDNSCLSLSKGSLPITKKEGKNNEGGEIWMICPDCWTQTASFEEYCRKCGADLYQAGEKPKENHGAFCFGLSSQRV